MDISPKIRYSDTSYIIFQQWQKGHEKVAFPFLYHYVYSKRLAHATENGNQQQLLSSNTSFIKTSSTLSTPPPSPAKSGPKIVRRKVNNANYRYDPKDGKKMKKRKSRELDRKRIARRSANSNIIEDSDDEDDDKINDELDKENIDEVDNSSLIKEQTTENDIIQRISHSPKFIKDKNNNNSEQVIADIHHQPNSILHIDESIPCNTTKDDNNYNNNNSVPDNKLIDNSLNNYNNNDIVTQNMNDIINEENELIKLLDKNKQNHINSAAILSVPIRRKQYNRISDSSSLDESDTTDPEYAKVELRNKNLKCRNTCLKKLLCGEV